MAGYVIDSEESAAQVRVVRSQRLLFVAPACSERRGHLLKVVLVERKSVYYWVSLSPFDQICISAFFQKPWPSSVDNS